MRPLHPQDHDVARHIFPPRRPALASDVQALLLRMLDQWPLLDPV
jgi:hypothetical protein